MDDNDFVIMDALFAEVKRLNSDLQEEDAKEAPEGDETMESNVLKAVEEISGYTPDEMIAMYNDYGRMAKEWEAYASAGLSPEVCAEYRKFEDEVVASGMTFGEVVELMHKKQDGRLVVLPCKVGDIVYVITQVFNGNKIERAIGSRKIDSIGGNALNPVWVVSLQPYELHFFPSEFGKTVFLARDEAEKTLGKEQG